MTVHIELIMLVLICLLEKAGLVMTVCCIQKMIIS